jgi:hypothetical protein
MLGARTVALGAWWAGFGICFVATHLTVALGSGVQTGRAGNPRVDGVLVGVAAGAAWALLFIGVTVASAGTYRAAPFGAAIGLPLGSVIGWQVGAWQEAVSWSHQRGALYLGRERAGRFLVARPYTVTPRERMTHVMCTGPTGTGKSTLVRNLIVQDLLAGAGVCVIDPKDDLIDALLPHVPDGRSDDVILFDAADTERPLGLNPFAGVPPTQRSVAASELLAVFRRYFVDAWGARLEHVLRNIVLALLEVPGATLADVPRLLLDRSYVIWVLEHVSNPSVREFFEVEYERVLKRRSDAIEPILNKVGPWLSYPELRNIISQPRSAFELRDVMDAGKVLLVRIPQGVFGEDVSNLLGALIVAKVQLAAQSRVDTRAPSRRPFYLYVDEFQNFATTSFAKIVTEARAFNVGLVCLNQYPEQLSRQLQLAMTKNAGTFIQTTYKGGRHRLEVVRQEDIREKKPLVHAVRPPPPLAGGDQGRSERLRALSRERYGRTPCDTATGRTQDHGEKQTMDADVWGRDIDED